MMEIIPTAKTMRKVYKLAVKSGSSAEQLAYCFSTAVNRRRLAGCDSSATTEVNVVARASDKVLIPNLVKR
jgi:hypothetical protein